MTSAAAATSGCKATGVPRTGIGQLMERMVHSVVGFGFMVVSGRLMSSFVVIVEWFRDYVWFSWWMLMISVEGE